MPAPLRKKHAAGGAARPTPCPVAPQGLYMEAYRSDVQLIQCRRLSRGPGSRVSLWSITSAVDRCCLPPLYVPLVCSCGW
jgi:hypothetical protein